jgi:hypothetical protein
MLSVSIEKQPNRTGLRPQTSQEDIPCHLKKGIALSAN